MKKCNVCGRTLNQEGNPLSVDCGGDCWGCIGETEALMGYEPSLEKVRSEIASGIRLPATPEEKCLTSDVMRLDGLIDAAEQRLDSTMRAQLMLNVAITVFPALNGQPKVLKRVMDAIGLATQWHQNGWHTAEKLYSFANSSETDGLAFQEAVATNPEELAAIIAITMAYYYTVWCAYIAEGIPNIPEDVEAVPTEAFQGVFQYAVDSNAVTGSKLCELLEQYLASQRT